MKQILLLGALFLFGATASAQSSSCTDKKAKTECTTASRLAAKARLTPRAAALPSHLARHQGKKRKKAKSGKEQGKQNLSMVRTEDKSEATDKKAKVSPAKGTH